MSRPIVLLIAVAFVLGAMQPGGAQPAPAPLGPAGPAPGRPTPTVSGTVHEYLLTPLTVRGSVTHLNVNDHGDVDGLILSSGEQVKFPPHNGATVVILLGQQPGAMVQASGYGTRNAFGTVVDAAAITVGSQTIALR